jgi:hypothetical protein
MATRAQVRRIALSLPKVEEAENHFAFSVPNKGKLKGFAWVWMEGVAPKKPRVPNPGVIVVRVANLGQKSALLSADRAKFFTEPHYDGFPGVLVRLDAVTVADLKVLLAEAWRCQAPADLAQRAGAAAKVDSRRSKATPRRSTATPRRRRD